MSIKSMIMMPPTFLRRSWRTTSWAASKLVLTMVSSAHNPSGIDVNGRQSLRALDDDITPRTEPDSPIQDFGDFFLDAMTVEQGLCARVQNNFGFEPRHKLADEIHDASVVLGRINDHLFGVRRKKIANRSGDKIQILVDQ